MNVYVENYTLTGIFKTVASVKNVDCNFTKRKNKPYEKTSNLSQESVAKVY